ncbi:unnamed protein product [Paramecium octaurelia]|uniref:Potassium channel domain-containing protein n=1 Tax=Paramecium octaurelia TaxID=43137 RepID=A0A8S1TZV0_PAROT|nr:unnamed protein product [Paramecium octaurelia]
MKIIGLKGLEDGRVTNLYFLKFEFMEKVCFVFNLVGIILAAIQYELEFEEYDSDDPFRDISQWLLWMIAGSTLLLIYFTYYRYQTKIQWLKSRGVIGPREKFYDINENFYMIIEIVIYCLIPLSFTETMRISFYNVAQGAEAYYHINEMLTLLMVVRVIYLYRTVLTLTFWASNRTLRVCDLYSCEHNYLFVVKSLLKTSPYLTQFLMLLSLIFVFGYQLRICERPLTRFNENIDNLGVYYNSVWCIIITITFVGYGDYYPRTDLGRFVVIVVCIIGVFLMSVMIVAFIESLKATPIESQTMSLLERIRLRELVKNEAAQVIKLSMQQAFRWRNGTLTEKKQHQIEIALRLALYNFKFALQQQSKFGMDNQSENIINHIGFLGLDLKQLRNEQNWDVRLVMEKLEKQEQLSKQLMEKLNAVLSEKK